MQIRKHPAICGALPHTRDPSLEQAMCQEPLGRAEQKREWVSLCNLELWPSPVA